VGGLAAGASSTVSLDAGNRPIGSYTVSAVVDPTNAVPEQNNDNNSFTASSQLVIGQPPGPDLQVLGIITNTPNPAVGVRNAIPDAPGGGGIEASISLYINGSFVQKLTLSSRHSLL
jgi:subtilase family serine protease